MHADISNYMNLSITGSRSGFCQVFWASLHLHVISDRQTSSPSTSVEPSNVPRDIEGEYSSIGAVARRSIHLHKVIKRRGKAGHEAFVRSLSRCGPKSYVGMLIAGMRCDSCERWNRHGLLHLGGDYIV